MSTLQSMYPSLSLFSDLDWAAVTLEYETDFIDVSFPEYLQQKALEGDCPLYLFELAFFEMAMFETKTSVQAFPHQPGIYLNPTALFLSLEFDVVQMINDALRGKIHVLEKNHVLGIFRNQKDEIQTIDLTEEELQLLQHLEDGPQPNEEFVSLALQTKYQQFIQNGLILNLIKSPVK